MKPTKYGKRNEDGKAWSSVAVENGLSAASFYKRIRKGMTPEQAATAPRKLDILGTEAEKECVKCRQVKDVKEFYKRKTGTFETVCKICVVDYVRNWRKENPEKFKAERERNHDKYLKAKRKWDGKNKGKLKALNRVYKRLHHAVKVGKVVKADVCEFCGIIDKPLDGAHYDYDKPLEVKWLCKSCHAKWDYNEPKTGGISNEL